MFCQFKSAVTLAAGALSAQCYLSAALLFSLCASWSVELKTTAVPKVPACELKCFRLLKNEHTNVWMSFIY